MFSQTKLRLSLKILLDSVSIFRCSVSLLLKMKSRARFRLCLKD
ncbi:unnamed protein product [Callosobruchus maculatus]|uniref:Uncharacterized protein n=1 Tax=Callosobruchus maculatus TaxID=64391 RepID=A0A653CT46_CALMS|nr:unnamed protein product [Callosobruchus maculatus]